MLPKRAPRCLGGDGSLNTRNNEEVANSGLSPRLYSRVDEVGTVVPVGGCQRTLNLRDSPLSMEDILQFLDIHLVTILSRSCRRLDGLYGEPRPYGPGDKTRPCDS